MNTNFAARKITAIVLTAATLSMMLSSAGRVSADAKGGAKYKVTDVRAGATDSYKVTFLAGRPAEIAVSGDGDTDLDLEVLDENGHVVASDTDASDDCYVRWTPRWTGTFTIKVKNLGRVYNHYVLVTN